MLKCWVKGRVCWMLAGPRLGLVLILWLLVVAEGPWGGCACWCCTSPMALGRDCSTCNAIRPGVAWSTACYLSAVFFDVLHPLPWVTSQAHIVLSLFQRNSCIQENKKESKEKFLHKKTCVCEVPAFLGCLHDTSHFHSWSLSVYLLT